jgi:hypothetical protein
MYLARLTARQWDRQTDRQTHTQPVTCALMKMDKYATQPGIDRTQMFFEEWCLLEFYAV